MATLNAANPTFSYGSSGLKLIRLQIRDGNAAGNCVATVDRVITISPSLVAMVSTRDVSNNPTTPDFCQEAASPFSTFTVSELGPVSGGTHELSLRYKMPIQLNDRARKPMKYIPCPTFNHRERKP
ncbi:MAG: hypothetical protein ACK5DD_05555 [Cyclobacteriaceae bacterium]